MNEKAHKNWRRGSGGRPGVVLSRLARSTERDTNMGGSGGQCLGVTGGRCTSWDCSIFIISDIPNHVKRILAEFWQKNRGFYERSFVREPGHTVSDRAFYRRTDIFLV